MREIGMLQQGRRVDDNELGVLISEMHIDFPDMGEVIVIGRLCCLGFTVSRDQVHSTIRSTANIAQVQSLKTGSIVFPLVTFSCNENTLYVSKYTPKHTQQNSGWQPLPLSPMQLLQ